MINIENISILVVDDTRSMLLTIEKMLENLKIGKNVWFAENGKEGLEILNTVKCDIALLDWNMPVMNGIEMLEKIRNDKALRDLPVIIVTAETDQDSVLQAVKMEIDGYLVKPLTLTSLEEKIKAVVEKVNHPDLATQQRLMARNLEEKGEYETAIEHIKTALIHNPASSRLLRRLGLLHFKINKDAIAEKCLLKAASLNEYDTITRVILADYYINHNELEKAGKYYLEILSLSTQYHDQAMALARRLLINGYRQMSVDIFSKLVIHSDKQNDLRQTVIDFCITHNELEYAQVLLEKSFKENPSNYDVLYKIGMICQLMADWGKALKCFLEIDRHLKNHLETKLQIAKIYYRIGKILIAEDYLDQILGINPENQEAIALRKKL